MSLRSQAIRRSKEVLAIGMNDLWPLAQKEKAADPLQQADQRPFPSPIQRYDVAVSSSTAVATSTAFPV
jgi:hypothetical protein